MLLSETLIFMSSLDLCLRIENSKIFLHRVITNSHEIQDDWFICAALRYGFLLLLPSPGFGIISVLYVFHAVLLTVLLYFCSKCVGFHYSSIIMDYFLIRQSVFLRIMRYRSYSFCSRFHLHLHQCGLSSTWYYVDYFNNLLCRCQHAFVDYIHFFSCDSCFCGYLQQRCLLVFFIIQSYLWTKNHIRDWMFLSDVFIT